MFGLFKRIFGRKKQKEQEKPPKTKLTRAEIKQLNAILAKVKKRNNGPATAQDTIPYLRMYPDGICQLDENYFSKTVQYFDINYELSHHDEKLAVLEEWGDFLNFFDPSVLFQFNYVNLQDDAVELSRSFDPVNRNSKDDPIAGELKNFLENVYAQGSNDQARLKFCTFTVTADNLRSARMRLNQVEGGVKEHMNRLGCSCEIMDGKDRLRLLHTIFHLDKREKFNFEWKWLPLTGLSTKDFIAPSSFEFRESRYSPMVWAMEGQVIRIAPNSTDYINPLDINLESYAPGESPLQLKAEFVLSLCELMLGDKEGLQTIQKSVIDAALQIIYRPFFNDPKKENLPILGDLYEALREMNTERADNVADALEIYVTGSLNLFNHQTNVDVNNRVVCYDIRDLGTQLKPAGMFIVQEQVWSRVAANREKGKYTRYYMDEFHVLLQTPQTAAYSVQIWKRFRKYGGLPMGITQNINDLTRNQGTDNILNNTSYIYMLNQSAGDRKDLAAHLNLSPHQLKKVTDSAPGVGLLYCENAIIPIESHIPEDTNLYKLMTTKPQEVYQRNLMEGKNHEE